MLAVARNRLSLLAIALVALLATATGTNADGQRYLNEVFSSVQITHNIAYGQPVTLLLDLYQPSGDTEPLRPAFVWIHGGGFTGGDKADSLQVEIATRWAKRGYVAISINYRLRPGHYFVQGDPELTYAVLDAQHDGQAAVRWLRANADTYRIDANRIGVGGSSAGAITSLQVAYNSGDPGESGNPGYPSTVSAIVDISGAMATSLIDAGEPPVLVIHGTVDERVAYASALSIVARAQGVGVPVEFHPLEDTGHDVWSAHKSDIINWMSDFLFRYVAPQPAVGGVIAHSALSTSGHGPSMALPLIIFPAVAASLALAAGALYAVKRRRLVTRRPSRFR